MGAAADPDAVDPARPDVEGAAPGTRASDAGPVARSASVLAPFLPYAAAFALAVLLRCLSIGLPIEADPVAYGSLARSLVHGDGYTIDGASHDRYPPMHPLLLALTLAFGGTVTSATRWLGALLGGVVAVLLVSIGRRIGRGKEPVALLVVLAAAHPALALFGGGLVAGSEATGLAMCLGATRLALVGSRRARTGALVLTGLLPLVRYDLVAFPIAVLWLVDRHFARRAGGKTVRGWLRLRWPAIVVLFLPLVVWIARTWIVSGMPFGRGYEASGVSLARVPRNVLVLVALVLPAAGLGILWIFVPSGLRRLWNARSADRPIVRTALLGAGVHLTLVALFAGPVFQRDGALAFSSGSLRFGLAAVPFLVLAAVTGLAARPANVRRLVVVSVSALSLLLSVWLLSGGIQRALPFPVKEAGRLHLLREAYDAAVAEAAPTDWIALDLSKVWPDGAPRNNAGLEVFLGDRAPSRRTGVVAAEEVARGVFPKASVLPLRDGLGGSVRCWLVSDLDYDGVVFTGERRDLHQGGQGIFQRIGWKEIEGGRAGSYTIHQVIRPPK